MAYSNKSTKAQPNVVNGQMMCPQCGAVLELKEGQYGSYYGCSARCGYNISTKQVTVTPNKPSAPVPTTTTTSTPSPYAKKNPTVEGLRAKFDEVMAEFKPEIDSGFLKGEDVRAMAIHLNIGK